MGAYVEVGGSNSLRGWLVALKGERATKHRHWQSAFPEQPHDAPKPNSAAVFEHALRRQVPPFDALVSACRLRKSDLGEAFAVPNRRFGAFLVVHHKIDREARPVRPFGIGWGGTVADEISVMGLIHCRTFRTCRRCGVRIARINPFVRQAKRCRDFGDLVGMALRRGCLISSRCLPVAASAQALMLAKMR